MQGCKPCFKTKNKAWKKQKKEEEESKCSGKVEDDDGNETLDLEWMKKSAAENKTDRKRIWKKKENEEREEKKNRLQFEAKVCENLTRISDVALLLYNLFDNIIWCGVISMPFILVLNWGYTI